MDLDLLNRTLADLGEPGYRAAQIWRWNAQGASGFEAMTDLPLALREKLQAQLPFSTASLPPLPALPWIRAAENGVGASKASGLRCMRLYCRRWESALRL